MGVNIKIIDQRTKKKGESDCIPWDFLRDFILKHSGEDQTSDVFTLAVYALVIFPRVLEHVEVVVVDPFV